MRRVERIAGRRCDGLGHRAELRECDDHGGGPNFGVLGALESQQVRLALGGDEVGATTLVLQSEHASKGLQETKVMLRPGASLNASPSRLIRATDVCGVIVRYAASVKRRRVSDFLVRAMIMALPLAVVGAGVYYLSQQLTGTPGTATVKECHLTGTRATRGYVCTGTWAVNGKAVGSGTINGAVSGDQGKRLDIAIRDGAAYTTSLATPIMLIALGSGVALLFGFIVWRGRRATVPQ